MVARTGRPSPTGVKALEARARPLSRFGPVRLTLGGVFHLSRPYLRRSVGKVLSLGFSNPGQGFLTLRGRLDDHFHT